MHYSEPVQKAINYISENLTAELSLEVLALYTHFSSHHFHRLFLLCTGEAPMEYVRRMRLRAASRDLLSTSLNVMGISLKYGFESQDGFCRAFKRYYGITPGEYKKLNFKKQSDCRKQIQEEKAIMYDMSIYENLACSHEEKKEALVTLDKILDLSQKAKCSGLLSLEAEMDTVQPEFFRKSVQMLIDGIEPECLREILMNYILCGGLRGKDLLIRILILEGTLAIQQGVNTLILREKLSSFFGEDFMEEIKRHFNLDSGSQAEKLESFMIKILDKLPIAKETSLLEEPLGRLDNRSLQRLLRDIDSVTLALAVSGASGKIQAKVMNNVSKKLALVILDELEASGKPVTAEIKECQKQILEAMHSLRNQGDIML